MWGVQGKEEGGGKRYCGSNKNIIMCNERDFHTSVYPACIRAVVLVSSMRLRIIWPWPEWLSWLERHSVNQKVVGSIPSQGTCLRCGSGSSWGTYERQPIDVSHMDVSLPLSLLPFHSL